MQVASWQLKFESLQSELPSIVRRVLDEHAEQQSRQVLARLTTTFDKVQNTTASEIFGHTPTSAAGTQPGALAPADTAAEGGPQTTWAGGDASDDATQRPAAGKQGEQQTQKQGDADMADGDAEPSNDAATPLPASLSLRGAFPMTSPGTADGAAPTRSKAGVASPCLTVPAAAEQGDSAAQIGAGTAAAQQSQAASHNIAGARGADNGAAGTQGKKRTLADTQSAAAADGVKQASPEQSSPHSSSHENHDPQAQAQAQPGSEPAAKRPALDASGEGLGPGERVLTEAQAEAAKAQQGSLPTLDTQALGLMDTEAAEEDEDADVDVSDQKGGSANVRSSPAAGKASRGSLAALVSRLQGKQEPDD